MLDRSKLHCNKNENQFEHEYHSLYKSAKNQFQFIETIFQVKSSMGCTVKPQFKFKGCTRSLDWTNPIQNRTCLSTAGKLSLFSHIRAEIATSAASKNMFAVGTHECRLCSLILEACGRVT